MPDRSLIIEAPAKVNLYLGVHDQKDERGYHRVDSVMAAVGVCDTVEIAPAETLSVATTPQSDCPMERNTAYRAAITMGEAFDRDPAFSIFITKRIPLCAGLGGPSTDAAAVLLGLCRLWEIDPADPLIDQIARSIGADVPFFLHGSLDYYDGGGDVLAEEFQPFAGMPVVLVKPEHAKVSTVEAYRTFDAAPVAPAPLDPMLDALRAADRDRAFTLVSNNLGGIACTLEPQIAEVMAWLRAQQGTGMVEVCGSGACVFAACDSAETAQRIANSVPAERDWWACATKFLDGRAIVF